LEASATVKGNPFRAAAFIRLLVRSGIRRALRVIAVHEGAGILHLSDSQGEIAISLCRTVSGNG
jgi:hypothetical protein